VLLTAAPSYLAADTRLDGTLSAQIDASIRKIPATMRTEALAWLPQLTAILHDHASDHSSRPDRR
jgi:hypothetical protein